MSNFPLISVIVPIYNVEKWLKACLNSLLSQSFSSYEVILVDDGSTDSSLAILNSFIEEHNISSDLFRVFSLEENQGQSAARNLALREAKGEFIVFVDSDDLVADDYLEKLYGLVEGKTNTIGALEFTYQISELETKVSKNQKIYTGDDCLRFLLAQIQTVPWKIYPHSFFEAFSFPEGEIFEDIGTVFELFLQADQVIYEPTKSYFYRWRYGSTVHRPFEEEHLIIIEQVKKLVTGINSNRPLLVNEAEGFAFKTLVHKSTQPSPYGPGYRSDYACRLWNEGLNYRKQALISKNCKKSQVLASYLGYNMFYWLKKLKNIFKKRT